MKKLKVCFLSLLLFISVVLPCSAESKPKRLVFNEIAAEFPLDGGGMLMLSRFWRLNRYLKAGVTVGGGVIQRDFELDGLGQMDLESNTSSLILPYIGPRLTADFGFIGLSLVYGAYYAKTDLEVERPGAATLEGEVSGWGTGFYSPFIVIDFYSEKYDLVFGFGLGGFLGSQFKDLEASSGATRITTDASPLDTLTLNIHTTWTNRREPMDSKDDDYFDELE